MNILFICIQFPYPPNSGEKIRSYNLIKHLSRDNNVFLVSFIKNPIEKTFINEMHKYCRVVEVSLLDKRSKIEHFPNIAKCILSKQPLDNAFYRRKELKNKIIIILKQNDIDIIQIEHMFMASYILYIPKCIKAKKILDFHNAEFVRYSRIYKKENNLLKKLRFYLNWVALKNWEPKFAMNFDVCLTTSTTDMHALNEKNPNLKISVIPNGIATDEIRLLPKSDSKTLLFVGSMNYEPNVDAVLYFYKMVFPLIRNIIPKIKFRIIGTDPPRVIGKLTADKSIFVSGHVKDVLPHYEQSSIAVVPLRSGGGTRIKILESMAFGRPVVSTSLGCEGLEVEHYKNILISNNPEQFAGHILELLKNSELYEDISKNARYLVEQKYDWRFIGKNIESLYRKILSS